MTISTMEKKLPVFPNMYLKNGVSDELYKILKAMPAEVYNKAFLYIPASNTIF